MEQLNKEIGPTCQYCKWWTEFPAWAKKQGYGVCEIITTGSAKAAIDAYGGIDFITVPEFGCNQWEKK